MCEPPSEVDTHLHSQHECIRHFISAAGVDDVLQVGLDEHGALLEFEAPGQLEDRLGVPAVGRPGQPARPLSAAEISAWVSRA